MIDANSTYAAGSTGGSSTHTHTTGDCTLTAAQSGIRAHSHGLNSHKHSVGAHSHGLNSHTHNYAKPNSPTGSTTLTVEQIPPHDHYKHIRADWGTSIGSTTGFSVTDGRAIKDYYSQPQGNTGGGKGHTHTIGTTSTASGGPSKTTTADSTAFDSGAASGSTANNTAAAATAAHNHGDTGSGSNIQP